MAARRQWRWSVPVCVVVIGFFAIVDLAFLIANLVKIPEGGWFPLVIGAVILILMPTWRRGRQIVLARTGEDNPKLRRFIADLDPKTTLRVQGTAVYLTARRETIPYALMGNLRRNKVLHERIVLLMVITERVPYVPDTERMEIEAQDKGFFEITLHFGFADALAVAAALEAHQAEFPIDIEATSFLLG